MHACIHMHGEREISHRRMSNKKSRRKDGNMVIDSGMNRYWVLKQKLLCENLLRTEYLQSLKVSPHK